MKYLKFFSIHKRLLSTSINEVRVRFAPSPTGKLHIGGLRTAFYNYLFAKKHNGKFILRIEDTDQDRIESGSLQHIIESLKWANLVPDYGPTFGALGDIPEKELFQSNRLHHYKNHVKTLLDKKTAYKCFCDEARLELLRKNAVKQNMKIAYDGKCRHLSDSVVKSLVDSGKPYVVRFKIEDREVLYDDLVYGSYKVNLLQTEGDFVLMKSDGFPTYHFANVIDDHLMRITHVLRGQEWQSSTPKHLLLYESFGWKPPSFAHLPLIFNKNGTKVSKRQKDIDVLSFRERGYFPEALIGYLTTFSSGFAARTHEQQLVLKHMDELIQLFDLKFILTRPIKLNEETLMNINKAFIGEKLKNDAEKRNLIEQLRQIVKSKYKEVNSSYLTDSYLTKVLTSMNNRIIKLNDLVEPLNSYFWTDFKFNDFSKLAPLKLTNENISFAIELFIKFIESVDFTQLDDENCFNKFKNEFQENIKEFKMKIKPNEKFNLAFLYRHLLCGNNEGPPIVEILHALGKENSLYRLNNIKSFFNK